jgi:hypothetical protein
MILRAYSDDENSVVYTCDLLMKLFVTQQAKIEQEFRETILRIIVLCTAHVKSQARKSSRSCIANYVRVFKNLKPVIESFAKEGIQSNNNAYTKQCIILILPNLLLLDTSIVSATCDEFKRLVLALVKEAEHSK